MNSIDFFIFGISVISGLLFGILGISKIYKTYLGVLLGLLFCILIHLKLNALTGTTSYENIIDLFLSKHKIFFSNLSILSLPIFGVVTLANNNLSFRAYNMPLLNIVSSFILGLILIPFIFGMYFIMYHLHLVNTGILVSIIDFLRQSSFWEILPHYEYVLFLILFGILLYKFVIYYCILIIFYILERLHTLRKEERENRHLHQHTDEDTNEDDENHKKEATKHTIDLK